MAHDIFICHASEDRALANALVSGLEKRGIGCWIAPRDVMPGADYAQAIVGGITGAKALLLVFSEHSNVSPHVSREVERGVSHGIDIIPFRVQELTPSRSLEYFISGAPWLDGTSGTLDEQVDRTARLIRQRVFGDSGGGPREETQRTLRDIVDRYGPEVADDARRVQALLRDMVGENRAEVATLVAAAEEGVGATLLQSSRGLAPEAAKRLARRLQDNRALTEDAAVWAVAAWLHALGVEGPTEAEMTTPIPTGAPEPAPAPSPGPSSPTPPVGETIAAGSDPPDAATIPAGDTAAPSGRRQPVERATPPPPATPPPSRPPTPPPFRPPGGSDRTRKRLIAVAITVAVLIAIVLGALALSGGDDEPESGAPGAGPPPVAAEIPVFPGFVAAAREAR